MERVSIETNCRSTAENASVASVTVAYNGARVLPRQMKAILGQTRGLGEIIVVDNGSSDGTAEMLRERYPQAEVMYSTIFQQLSLY